MLSLFFSSRRRHTRCALVTGVQTCALPISRIGGRRSDRMARTWLILSALVAGLALGVGWTRLGLAGLIDAVKIADSIGGVWFEGLRMTIITLVVSILITGNAKKVDSERGARSEEPTYETHPHMRISYTE